MSYTFFPVYWGEHLEMLDFFYGQETNHDPSAYLGGITMLQMVEIKRLDVIPIERSDYCPNCECYLSFINDVSFTNEQVKLLYSDIIRKIGLINGRNGFQSKGLDKLVWILEEAVKYEKGLCTLSD